jgi:hypothetical protein
MVGPQHAASLRIKHEMQKLCQVIAPFLIEQWSRVARLPGKAVGMMR